jgi:hypothetical protein
LTGKCNSDEEHDYTEKRGYQNKPEAPGRTECTLSTENIHYVTETIHIKAEKITQRGEVPNNGKCKDNSTETVEQEDIST